MASIKSQKFTVPKYMPVNGVAAYFIDKVALAANPANADTLDFHIPAGVEVAEVHIQTDDLDTNGTPAMAFNVGYAPIAADSALAANATYFAAVGQTTMRTGGRLPCAFKPIKFEEDVMLRVTISAQAATFAAGEVIAIVSGNCLGPK